MNGKEITKMVVIVMMAFAGFHASGVTTDGDFAVHSALGVSPDTAVEVAVTATDVNELHLIESGKEGFDVDCIPIHIGPHSDTDHTVCANLHRVRLNSRQRRQSRLAGASWRRRLSRWTKWCANRPIRKMTLRRARHYWNKLSSWEQTKIRARVQLMSAVAVLALVLNIIGMTGLSIMSMALMGTFDNRALRDSTYRSVGEDGRHVEDGSFFHVLSQMTRSLKDKVTKGANHRKMIRRWRALQTDEIRTYGEYHRAVVNRAIVEKAKSNDRAVIRFDPSDETDVTARLSSNRDIQEYGARAALGENSEEAANYRVPTEQDVKDAIVLERYATETWELAMAATDEIVGEVDYKMRRVPRQGDQNPLTHGWAVKTAPTLWTKTP